jgi:hypothetical protein
MPHPAYRIGIGAGVLATIAALGWMVFADDPPGGVPPGASPSTQSEAGAKSMAKAVATGNRPAIVTVEKPLGGTRSLGGAGEADALQITVRPEVVERSEPYLVNVYVLAPGGGANAGGQTPPPGPGGGQPAAEATLLGSFSFFPPPRAGEERTFTLPPPKGGGPAGGDVSLKVELVPASPDNPVEKSTLEIMEAKIGPP